MAIEVFNGSSIPRELTTAPMEFLWAKWKTLNDTNSLTLQRLTEECSYQLRANSTHLLSVGDDFSYIYVGDALQAAYSESVPGTLLSDNPSPLKREFAEVYRQVAKRITPAFIRFTGTRSENGELWQRLVLPIPLAGGGVILMMYSELINHQMEVYEYLFRTASDAMVVTYPIANDAGHTIDGWIVMINERARQLLNFDGSIGNLRLTEIPQFANVGLWDRLHTPKSSAPSTITTADFKLDIMRFSHVFGLRIRPKAETMHDDSVTLAPGHHAAGIPASA